MIKQWCQSGKEYTISIKNKIGFNDEKFGTNQKVGIKQEIGCQSMKVDVDDKKMVLIRKVCVNQESQFQSETLL